MEVIFKKGKNFKKLIENCNNLINVGTLKFNKEGIFLNTIDINQTAVIYFHINTDNFTKFNLNKEYILSIDFTRLSKVIFKTYKDTDEMKIKYKEESDKLKFIFKNTVTKKVATFTLPLLNDEQEEVELPEIDYDSEVIITPETIYSITKDCAVFGSNLNIKTIKCEEANKIVFSITDINGKAEYEYEENEADVQEINIKNEINLTFLMSYISKFANFSTMSNSLKIYLTNNIPLLYYYKTNIAEIKLYLSPNIEDV